MTTTFKYKITVSYDGAAYGGWQIQANAISIQGLIEKNLARILRAPISIVGSGRTDAGVHALSQVAHFVVAQPIDVSKTRASLNGLLPPDIRIMRVEEVPSTFHARYSAASKTYHYRLHLDATIDPFKRHYAYHVRHPVDLELLKREASFFVGTHDFTSLTNKASEGAAAKNAVRTLYRLDVVLEPGGVRLELEGNGFLYQMVRNIVGTLLDICAGKIAEGEIPSILHAKNRARAGKAAPAHGLYLTHVRYAE